MSLLPPDRRTLCAVTAIPDGTARGFRPAPGGFTGLLALRQGEQVRVYANSCPHLGTPLDWAPDQFFSRDGRHLVCATHGALFTPETGLCVAGPCEGRSLEPIAFTIEDGRITVDAEAGL